MKAAVETVSPSDTKVISGVEGCTLLHKQNDDFYEHLKYNESSDLHSITELIGNV